MRRMVETNALVNLIMTVMLDDTTILFVGREGIMVNKVRETFKMNCV
jgi:hypothetical protein